MKRTETPPHLRVVAKPESSLLGRLAEALHSTDGGSRDEEILEELREIRGLLQVLLRRDAGMQTTLPPKRKPHLYVQSSKGYPFTRSGILPVQQIEERQARRTLESMISLYEDASRDFAS